MRTPSRPLLLVLALAIVAAVRVLLFAAFDQRPLYGGWEAPDLQRAMYYHYGLHQHLDWAFAEQVARDGFKPPLWYGGVPLLFGWKQSLAASDFLLVNALCVFAVVVGGGLLGRRLGGPIAGVLAAAFCAFLPGIAWRVTMIGVEPAHAVLLMLAVLLILNVCAQAALGRRALAMGVALGVVVGAGTLMKWNFAVYAIAPALVAFVGLRKGRTRAGITFGLAALVAAGLFLPWAMGVGDIADVMAQGASGEADGRGFGFYLGDLAAHGLGIVGWLALAIGGVALSRRSGAAEPAGADRPRVEAAVVGSAVLALWLVHVLIPHNETRYLLPALPLLSVVLGVGLARAVAWRGGAALVGAVVLLAGVESWGAPAVAGDEHGAHGWSDTVSWPTGTDYGLGAVISHPSLRIRERTVVTTSLRQDSYFPVLTFLNWELYGRNPNPVLSRSDWPDVTSKACAFDLERSTHFITNRDLDMHEESALRSMGFERVVTVSPRIQDVGALQLWALEARSQPRYR